MSRAIRMSRQTRANWLIDAAVLVGGILAALSGIYFLFVPSGGYRGGRNPAYGLQILFERHTWSDLHTWTGVLMIAAVVIHLSIHWRWVKMMAGRVVDILRDGKVRMSQGAWRNLALNALVAVGFVICAVSGIALLFLPSGGHGAQQAGFVFSRTTWDVIHTWSGVVLIAAVTVHFAIHWRWVKNVTKRFFQSLLPQPAADETPVAAGQMVR
jgi:cytochrome b subunit of formate dehydrogenase